MCHKHRATIMRERVHLCLITRHHEGKSPSLSDHQTSWGKESIFVWSPDIMRERVHLCLITRHHEGKSPSLSDHQTSWGKESIFVWSPLQCISKAVQRTPANIIACVLEACVNVWGVRLCKVADGFQECIRWICGGKTEYVKLHCERVGAGIDMCREFREGNLTKQVEDAKCYKDYLPIEV